jgi:hypothetical protein
MFHFIDLSLVSSLMQTAFNVLQFFCYTEAFLLNFLKYLAIPLLPLLILSGQQSSTLFFLAQNLPLFLLPPQQLDTE